MDSFLLPDFEIDFRCSQMRKKRKHLPEWKWTEGDWLACDDFRLLQIFHGIKFRKPGRRTFITKRKEFLIATSCCRKVWHLLKDDLPRSALRAAEQFAQGKITAKQRNQISGESLPLVNRYFWEGESYAVWKAAAACVGCASARPLLAAPNYVAEAVAGEAVLGLSHSLKVGHAQWKSAWEKQIEGPFIQKLRQQLALMFKDITGNPFRKIVFAPSWRTPAVMGQVHSILAQLGPYNLASLADSLGSAGCDNQNVLTHCRQSGYHYPGCWVLDGLLTVN